MIASYPDVATCHYVENTLLHEIEPSNVENKFLFEHIEQNITDKGRLGQALTTRESFQSQ
jgi:hypothetical protein